METNSITVTISPLPTHCPACGSEYIHIAHPMRPGVIMGSRCKCEIVITTIGNSTIVELVPPKIDSR